MAGPVRDTPSKAPDQRFPTSERRRLLERAAPGGAVRALASFPSDCQIKNDNSQHNSHLVSMN